MPTPEEIRHDREQGYVNPGGGPPEDLPGRLRGGVAGGDRTTEESHGPT